MLTPKDKFLMEIAIDIIAEMLKTAIDDNNHTIASLLGEVIDGLRDIKDR